MCAVTRTCDIFTRMSIGSHVARRGRHWCAHHFYFGYFGYACWWKYTYSVCLSVSDSPAFSLHIYIYIIYIYIYVCVCVCGFISTFIAKGCNGVDVRNGISLIQHSFSLPQICHRIRHGSRHTCVVLRLVRHKKTFDTIMPGVTQKHMAPNKMSYPKHQMPLPHQSFAYRGSCASQQSWTPNRV